MIIFSKYVFCAEPYSNARNGILKLTAVVIRSSLRGRPQTTRSYGAWGILPQEPPSDLCKWNFQPSNRAANPNHLCIDFRTHYNIVPGSRHAQLGSEWDLLVV